MKQISRFLLMVKCEATNSLEAYHLAKVKIEAYDGLKKFKTKTSTK